MCPINKCYGESSCKYSHNYQDCKPLELDFISQFSAYNANNDIEVDDIKSNVEDLEKWARSLTNVDLKDKDSEVQLQTKDNTLHTSNFENPFKEPNKHKCSEKDSNNNSTSESFTTEVYNHIKDLGYKRYASYYN